MHPRAAQLIRELALDEHPEGGHYRRIHESALRVPSDRRAGGRAALTAIHFLLTADEVSRWHRVDADESWHHAEGDTLELFVFDPDARNLTRHRLGRFDAVSGTSPLVVVPAHHWQAARPLGAYALVGCSVGPGFEFAGFTMLDQAPAIAALIAAADPDLASLAWSTGARHAERPVGPRTATVSSERLRRDWQNGRIKHIQNTRCCCPCVAIRLTEGCLHASQDTSRRIAWTAHAVDGAG